MNKKILVIFLIILFSVSAVFSQTSLDDFEDLSNAFTEFSGGMADSLPFAAAVGLNWGKAYLGQFPHLGAGITAGAVALPSGAFEKVFTAFGLDNPLEEYLSGLPFDVGLPFPVALAEVRIGGFLIPFDLGVKVGTIPDALYSKLDLELPFDFNYLVYGADLRFALTKEKGFVPSVSIGAGYTHMEGNIGLKGLMGGDITLANFELPNPDNDFNMETHTLSLTDPDLGFSWQTDVIDLKVQVSKNLYIITPYIGAGLSYGVSKAGGGLYTSLQFDGAPLTETEIAEINAAFKAYNDYLKLAGQPAVPVPEFSEEGVVITAMAQHWVPRIYGGICLNILILKIDLTALYNPVNNTIGASAGIRIQF